MTQAPWWKGTRGEWYVVIQVPLFLLVACGPRTLDGWPAWPAFLYYPTMAASFILGVGGMCMLLTAFFQLGANLTPLPYPKTEGTLIETGPYRFVRHPIYSGAILLALGWALWVQGWLTLVYGAVLFVFFEIKSRHEEHWLGAKYSMYADYKKRVRKLIPFVY